MIEFSEKKYNTIVIDPAWDIHLSGKVHRRPNRAGELPYKTMSLQEIKEIPIGKIANIGCHVYCWTTNRMLRDTFDVLQAWGVNYHLTMVLAKPNGMCPCFGYKFATEFCLLGFYGKPMQKFTKIGELNWFKGFNKAGEHSVKPDEFYKIVEKMSPAPRIDVFARRQRLNWDVFGDEVDAQIPLNLIIHEDLMKEHYLDKQKVREAIRNPKNFLSSEIGHIPDLEAIKKELGL